MPPVGEYHCLVMSRVIPDVEGLCEAGHQLYAVGAMSRRAAISQREKGLLKGLANDVLKLFTVSSCLSSSPSLAIELS